MQPERSVCQGRRSRGNRGTRLTERWRVSTLAARGRGTGVRSPAATSWRYGASRFTWVTVQADSRPSRPSRQQTKQTADHADHADQPDQPDQPHVSAATARPQTHASVNRPNTPSPARCCSRPLTRGDGCAAPAPKGVRHLGRTVHTFQRLQSPDEPRRRCTHTDTQLRPRLVLTTRLQSNAVAAAHPLTFRAISAPRKLQPCSACAADPCCPSNTSSLQLRVQRARSGRRLSESS